MGHANLSNLSKLFINLLYAKGRVSIDDAVQVAIKRKVKLQASEGEYEDDGMLAVGFNDVVSFLSDGTGNEYSYSRDWDGPWIEPEFIHRLFSVNINKIPETSTVTELLRQCCAAYMKRVFGNVLEDETLFGVCADAIQDMGDDSWASRVRNFPRQFRAWRMHELKKWNYFDEEENWKAFDSIKWVFCKGWRNRYRDVPYLSHVTH